MEGELFNAIQKQENVTPAEVSRGASPLPKLSFVPPELLKKDLSGAVSAQVGTMGAQGLRGKCAVGGVVFGGLSLICWVVIIFGILASSAGIALSVAGLRSNSSKYARIGLGLSIFGVVAALLYAFAAYQGMINYNYFTSDFWG